MKLNLSYFVIGLFILFQFTSCSNENKIDGRYSFEGQFYYLANDYHEFHVKDSFLSIWGSGRDGMLMYEAPVKADGRFLIHYVENSTTADTIAYFENNKMYVSIRENRFELNKISDLYTIENDNEYWKQFKLNSITHEAKDFINLIETEEIESSEFHKSEE